MNSSNLLSTICYKIKSWILKIYRLGKSRLFLSTSLRNGEESRADISAAFDRYVNDYLVSAVKVSPSDDTGPLFQRP